METPPPSNRNNKINGKPENLVKFDEMRGASEDRNEPANNGMVNENRSSQQSSSQISPEFSDDEYYKIIKPVRTYERDLAEYVRNTGGSKTEVNLKEQKKKREKRKVENTKEILRSEKSGKSSAKNLFLLVIGVLVFASAGSFVFLWLNNSEKEPEGQIVTPTVQFETIITGDSKKLIEVTERDRGALAFALEEAASQEATNTGKIIIFGLADKISDQRVAMSPATFLRRIESKAPSFLLRSFGQKMDFGLVSFSRFSSFVIFEVKDFNNAFAGMLQWEKNMAIDLFGWISEETASGRPFEDAILNGKDLRILKNEQGQVILLYAFLDEETLIITDKVSTFKELLAVW